MPDPSLSYLQFTNLIYGWILLACIIFFVLLKVTAPYGRHFTSGWGPQISDRAGWILMELPVLVILYLFVLPVYQTVSPAAWVMIALFSLHYINRTFVYPLRLRTRGKSMPLVIVASGIIFNIVNGFALGYFFANFEAYTHSWFFDVRFIGGLMIFLTGLYINWKADDILIHLRKPGELNYAMPQHWLFEKISCPNLLGELIEWFGFAILCWNLPALAFFIWTAANLIPRAMAHHTWYQKNFIDYPAQRRAVIPYLL